MQPDAALSSGQAMSYGSVQDGATVTFVPESKPLENEREEEAAEEAPAPDWEARGTIFGLIIDVGSVSAPRIVVLVGLMLGLKALEKNSIACNREESPLLESYSEVIFCHYTKAYVFCFPAIATGVLLCLMGRDLLQKRLYYGLLKAGAAISFTENVAYKDPFFMGLLLNFLHCVAFYVFTLNVVARGGENVIDAPEIEFNDTAMKNVTIQVSSTTTPAAAFAAMGYNQTHVGAIVGTHVAQESVGSIATLKILAVNFMPSILVIVAIFLAYDITMTLVPLSEYLRAFEAEDQSPIPDLCTFQDAIAKSLLEHSPEMIETADGNLQTLYEMMVDKYRRHKAKIYSVTSSKLVMDIEDETESQTSPRWVTSMKDLATIGLTKSLWPADLLLRRDVDGEGAESFRVFWITFAIIALLWLLNLQVFLIFLVVREAQAMASEIEMAIPLVIDLVHMVAVGVVMHVYCVTLVPLYQTMTLTPRSAGHGSAA